MKTKELILIDGKQIGKYVIPRQLRNAPYEKKVTTCPNCLNDTLQVVDLWNEEWNYNLRICLMKCNKCLFNFGFIVELEHDDEVKDVKFLLLRRNNIPKIISRIDGEFILTCRDNLNVFLKVKDGKVIEDRASHMHRTSEGEEEQIEKTWRKEFLCPFCLTEPITVSFYKEWAFLYMFLPLIEHGRIVLIETNTEDCLDTIPYIWKVEENRVERVDKYRVEEEKIKQELGEM